MNYTIAKAVLNGRSSIRMCANTHLHKTVAGIKLRYYDTDILYFKSNGDILVDVDDKFTKSTKDRLNIFLPFRHQGIYKKGNVWYWKDGTEFKNRTVVRDDVNDRRVLRNMTVFD